MEPHYVTTANGVRFFSDHYNRVDEARKQRGLLTRKDVLGPNNGQDVTHPWIGRKFRMKGRNDVFTVDQVYRQWYMGWYMRMFSYVNDTKSHAEHIIEASECQCQTFLDGYMDFCENAVFIS